MWADALWGLDRETLSILLFIGGPLLVGVSCHVATQWRKVRVSEMEAALKQQMLDRGMAPAEIAQVMQTSKEPARAAEVGSTEKAIGDKASLVALLAENDYSGEAIERVLVALQEHPAGWEEGAATISKLVEHGMSGEDIARVLRAMHSHSANGQVQDPASMLDRT
jgi:hypothetical protein